MLSLFRRRRTAPDEVDLAAEAAIKSLEQTIAPYRLADHVFAPNQSIDRMEIPVDNFAGWFRIADGWFSTPLNISEIKMDPPMGLFLVIAQKGKKLAKHNHEFHHERLMVVEGLVKETLSGNYITPHSGSYDIPKSLMHELHAVENSILICRFIPPMELSQTRCLTCPHFAKVMHGEKCDHAQCPYNK